jgi:zeta-carotene desaturase
MEGATLSGRQTSARINEAGSMLHELRQRLEKEGIASSLQAEPATDELTFV